MCGLAGFLAPAGLEGAQQRVEAMLDPITHRGPDDRGTWVDAGRSIGLGLCRLAVVDLSAAGHQPMESLSGRYVMAFNGEIYNFRDLREDLEGTEVRFRGSSDTEVLLAAIEQWGLEEALTRCIGMFAFALWDRGERELHLVRDRIGVKPLYFGRFDGSLLFGSELRAIRAFPGFGLEIDPEALELYLRFGYVPEPWSIDRRLRKVPPGTFLTFGDEGAERQTTYWSAADMVLEGLRRPFEGDEEAAVERLDELLASSIGLRMIADVPVGVFLSGGIDSTLVTAMMQRLASRPVRTFTIGFAESGFDEAVAATRIAERLGTQHTTFELDARQALEIVPSLPAMFSEPFADSSQIPTHLVAKLARQEVTVALSGDGGDELFGGYVRHVYAASWPRIQRIPLFIRRTLGGILRRIPPSSLERLARALGPVTPSSLRQARAGEKLHKLAAVLPARTVDQMAFRAMSLWDPPPLRRELRHRDLGVRVPDELEDPASRVMLLDLLHYLPGDLLVKVDRATMAASLEAREPLLDHRLIEFAWTLPTSLKIRDGRGKWILRRLLGRMIPRELFDRPKMGFALPLGSWLRGPLREWAEALLNPRLLHDRGFDVERVDRVWRELLAGRAAHEHRIWTILMFEAWMEAGSDPAGDSRRS